MSQPVVEAMVEEYARGGPLLSQAIIGLTEQQFRARPVPVTWSIGQIVLHLLDSDLNASERMKRVIAEDNPPLIGMDESLFAERLFYDELDPQLAAEMFGLNRKLTAEILRRVPEEGFGRIGTHNQRGQVTLAGLVELYVGHLDHHLKFLRHKRRLLQAEPPR